MKLQWHKWLAARLPESWQHELRRNHYRREIKRRRFHTDEQEFALLPSLLRPGDWAVDIGANVGHYTMRMSELVGPAGRVIAMEPVPETFALLAANTRRFPHANVSLLNLAASDRIAPLGMTIPRFAGGLPNYYQAHLSAEPGPIAVLTIPIDSLALPPVRLVKLDVEGHELRALRGMRGLLARDHPTLIVETGSRDTETFLEDHGYICERLARSSNVLCHPGVGGTTRAGRRVPDS